MVSRKFLSKRRTNLKLIEIEENAGINQTIDGFGIIIMHLLTHRCLVEIFWSKTTPSHLQDWALCELLLFLKERIFITIKEITTAMLDDVNLHRKFSLICIIG